eukprot:m.332912 g.332912  ORF g.332912 m.332912 type:complete len:255 (+) comp17027_c0_seq1:77-841(+)
MGKGSAFTNETLSFSNIVCNVIYSIFLFANCLLTAIGLATYQWIETTGEDMAKSNINFDNVPGLNKVSCGLTTYCIDAAGQVAECSLPWPVYGDSPTDIPYTMWQAATGCITFGLLLLVLCWIYTIFACFGCFSSYLQKWSSRLCLIGGLFMLIGLLCWLGGFSDLAVSTCVGGVDKVDGDCPTGWDAVFPSDLIEGGVANIGCQICPREMKAFQRAETCKMGWGAYMIIVATVMSLILGSVAEMVTSRQAKEY